MINQANNNGVEGQEYVVKEEELNAIDQEFENCMEIEEAWRKKYAEYHENRIKNLRLTGEGEQKIDFHHHPLFYSKPLSA